MKPLSYFEHSFSIWFGNEKWFEVQGRQDCESYRLCQLIKGGTYRRTGWLNKKHLFGCLAPHISQRKIIVIVKCVSVCVNLSMYEWRYLSHMKLVNLFPPLLESLLPSLSKFLIADLLETFTFHWLPNAHGKIFLGFQILVGKHIPASEPNGVIKDSEPP